MFNMLRKDKIIEKESFKNYLNMIHLFEMANMSFWNPSSAPICWTNKLLSISYI